MDSNHRQEAYLSRVLSFCHLAYRSFHPAFSTLLSFFSLEESTRSLYAILNFSKPYGFVVGPSGLEPPTSCLSGTRSNLLSYDPMWLDFSVGRTLGFSISGTVLSVPSTDVSIELSSRTVSRKVFSPLQSLTSVFGMGTGGPSAFITLTLIQLTYRSLKIEQHNLSEFLKL